ncbi:heavy-metal-associated domain-containing protein [Pseudodesulfovibrio tunisiensis]|uniref:heavy-metal-associated domain-containing protein n=1 Tax=Pseudodesulfovibrio tunisiensis TaxID=463192 RepID=UPI001FB52326|nr:cation transporter [Pseudodesulfovibrio tunisiensis]
MPTIKINGMSCQHCVKSVTEALQQIDGITDVKVDLLAGTATYDEEKSVDPATVRDAIIRIGFEVAE